MDRYDNLWSSSNYSASRVHIAAPGVNLSLPTKNGGLDLWNGTSHAAPFVTGTAALLLSIDPSLTAEELKNIILGSADMVPALIGYVQEGRRLNVAEAVLSYYPKYMKEHYKIERYVPYSNRYAQINTSGVLQVKEGPSNSYWTVINNDAKNVVLDGKRIFYQTTNNYLYFREGELNSTSKTISTSGYVYSYAVNGDVLLTWGGNRLNVYLYDTNKKTYVWQDNPYDGVTKYALSGNRVILVRPESPNTFEICENIRAVNPTFQKYTVIGAITAMYTSDARLQVYYGTSGYAMYDSGGLSLTQMLQYKFGQSLNNNQRISTNQYLWCIGEGNKIIINRFNGDGEKSGRITQTLPEGETITACKIIGHRIYVLAGSHLYAFDSDSTVSATRYYLSAVVKAISISSTHIGIIDSSDGGFKMKQGALNAYWTTLGSQAAQIAVYI